MLKYVLGMAAQENVEWYLYKTDGGMAVFVVFKVGLVVAVGMKTKN